MLTQSFWEATKNGSLSCNTYGSIDGNTWGCILQSRYADPWSACGSIWEAAIEGDDWDACRAQTWYPTWEAAIAANEEDFDSIPENLVFRASEETVKEAGGIAAFYLEYFQEAGRSSPNGKPYYRPKS